MKNIYIIISAIAALALTSACNLSTDYPPMGGEDVITLDLQYSEPGTKSGGVGKENTIKYVDYFFYTDTTEAPIFSKRDPSPTVDGNKYTISLTAGSDGVPSISELFQNGKFEVYAVFNSPEAITAAPLDTVKKTAVGVTFATEGTNGWEVIPDNNDPQNLKCFVMTGQKTVNKASGGSYANVEAEKTVDMKRVAAKVEVNLKIQKEKVRTSDNTTWRPMLGANNVRLYLCNFVQNSLLSAADAAPTLPTEYTQGDYKVYAVNTDNLTATGNYYEIASQQSFYTYPIEWEAGADNEPFIKLIVPWIEAEGTVPNKELYYKIMFPPSITSIEANKFYKFDVTVDFLGDEGEPTVLIKGYNAQVVGWNENSDVSSSVAAATFLSVEKDSIKYFTQSSGIDFVSSEVVYLEINNVYQKNLKSGNNEYVVQNKNTTNQRTDLGTKAFIMENGRVVGLTVGGNEWIRVSNDNNYLEVGHQLNADLTSDHMDVTPWVYEITMKLVGVDGTDYDKTVVFEQWPNVYVIADPNSNNGATGNNGIFVNGYQTPYTTGNPQEHQYDGVTVVSTQGQTRYREQEDMYNLGRVRGITSNANNRNPNMYVITISVSDTYMIGDPRTTDINNFDDFVKGSGTRYSSGGWGSYYYYLSTETNWRSAPAVNENSNRTLSYYHPASSDNTADMIAPKIRIASSYGVCSTGRSWNEARYRCASYQEDGIPAGRWRLPTMAEVEFICTLSSLGRIPILFGDSSNNGQNPPTTASDSYYWTANGIIEVNNGNASGTVAPHVTRRPNATDDTYTGESVRCVYDEWFWGDATVTRPVAKGTFTWGDRNY